mgnify:CR=1 FL=1
MCVLDPPCTHIALDKFLGMGIAQASHQYKTSCRRIARPARPSRRGVWLLQDGSGRVRRVAIGGGLRASRLMSAALTALCGGYRPLRDKARMYIDRVKLWELQGNARTIQEISSGVPALCVWLASEAYVSSRTVVDAA